MSDVENRDFQFDPFLEANPTGDQVEFDTVVDLEDVKHVVKSDGIIYNFRNFKPFDYQAGLFQDMNARKLIKRASIILPRRAGKTIFMIIYLILRAITKAKKTTLNIIRYGLIYPDLAQGKDVAWEELDFYTEGLPKKSTDKARGSVSFVLRSEHGHPVQVSIKIVGLKNLEGRRGGGFDGIVIDERATIPEGFQKVVTPMVGDKVRQPTFQISIGTPREEGDFWSEYDQIRGKERDGDDTYYTFWSNYEKLKHINEDEYERFKLELSPEELDIELNCKRGVTTGAKYFISEIAQLESQGRVRQINDNPEMKKIIVVDPGGTTAASKDLFALWFIQHNMMTGRNEFINYEELSSVDTNKVYTTIQNTNYNIGQIILPWDAMVGLKSLRSIFRDLYPQAEITVLRRTTKKEMIRMSRGFFAKCEFDLNNTIVGLNCLKNYCKKWDSKNRVYLINPSHNQYSHGAEAFMYAALADSEKKLLVSAEYDIYNKKEVDIADSYNPNERWEGKQSQNIPYI